MQPEFRAEAPFVDPLAGAVIASRFRLVRLLGAGGMGRVYVAEPVAGGARVAIKLLMGEFLSEPAVVDRFLEEGRTCMRLVHPNIVRVIDTGRAEDGTPFIAMELLEGETLGARISPVGAPSRRLPLAEAAATTQAVLAALGAAHALGVVHRDLKPDNVFLSQNAPPNAAKILDFGVAKVVDAAGGVGSRTRTGMLLGTPGYMSPEQIKNAKAVDSRSDLFSTAVLFYEMLAGASPFPAANEFAKLIVILNEQPKPIESFDPALRPLGAFFLRALAKDRDARFQTAGEMSKALAATVGGGRAELAQTSPMVGGEAGAVIRSSTLASTPHTPVTEPPPQITIEPSTDRRAIAPWVVALLVVAALVAGFVLGFAVAQAQ